MAFRVTQSHCMCQASCVMISNHTFTLTPLTIILKICHVINCILPYLYVALVYNVSTLKHVMVISTKRKQKQSHIASYSKISLANTQTYFLQHRIYYITSTQLHPVLQEVGLGDSETILRSVWSFINSIIWLLGLCGNVAMNR